MRILTPDELKDIDSVGHGQTLVGVLDDDGDTHSIWLGVPCLPVIRVGHSDDDKHEAYRITVRDALVMVDTAGLNTTANDLRAKLEHERDCGQDGPCAVSPGCQRHWRERNRELVEQLAIANSTIASLRQRDTVRPAVDAAAIWDEGHMSGQDDEQTGTYTPNPYR
jgi:hypothetical protein